MSHPSTKKRRLFGATIAAAALVLTAAGLTSPSWASASHGRPAGASTHAEKSPATGHHGKRILSPEVIHTGKAPTGYEVTFRYDDPTATSVRLRGEWFFSSPSATTTTSSQGLLPTQWQPGDFPIASPNQGAAPNWPVVDMTQDKTTGVWSYTTPLPSGTFTYGFYVDCTSAAPALTGCTELSDPANPPWNTSGSVEPTSQVYVPSDPRFGTLDLSWQSPRSRTHGRLLDVSYPDAQSTNPVGTHPLAVYLPPGYSQRRHAPYPVLVLSHGGGGNEVDWSTQGAAGAILDNLIGSRKIAPMVVVMTNFNNLGTCTGQDVSCYDTDLRNYVLPYVQAHFNVSDDPAQRAFAGLSAGAARANYLLFHDTGLFGYYASWSIGNRNVPADSDPLWSNPALHQLLGLQVGGGLFDSITVPSITAFETSLAAHGVPFTTDLVLGGHEWYTWRQLLYNFLTTVAFKPAGTP